MGFSIGWLDLLEINLFQDQAGSGGAGVFGVGPHLEPEELVREVFLDGGGPPDAAFRLVDGQPEDAFRDGVAVGRTRVALFHEGEGFIFGVAGGVRADIGTQRKLEVVLAQRDSGDAEVDGHAAGLVVDVQRVGPVGRFLQGGVHREVAVVARLLAVPLPGAQETGVGQVELGHEEGAGHLADVPMDFGFAVFLGSVFGNLDDQLVRGRVVQDEPAGVGGRLDDRLVGIVRDFHLAGIVPETDVVGGEGLHDDTELMDDGLAFGLAGFHLDDGVAAFQAGVFVHGDLDLVAFHRQVAPGSGLRRHLERALQTVDLDDAVAADGLEGDVGAGHDGHFGLDVQLEQVVIGLAAGPAGDKGDGEDHSSIDSFHGRLSLD